MTWTCPECKNRNEDSIKECKCGYAFYKILGIKPDANAGSIKQTHRYLLSVWQKDYPDDPKARKKTEERLKKINEAYEISKIFAPDVTEPVKGSKAKFIYIGGGSLALVIILILFFGMAKEDKPGERTASSQDMKSPAQPGIQAEVKNKPQSQETASQPAVQTAAPLPLPATLPAASERNEEWAIETVKKSHILDKFFDAEAVMKKWADENAGKLKVMGWQAKKMDEQMYVVSYTASDGLAVKGFYFDVEATTGNVRHLANHPELQQKYGIQYNR